jgi:RNA 3'-terminal phosphate cyclase (ATP)
MIQLDGSQQSGSGTIVRYAVALAALLGRELRLTNARARRRPPGLRPQHLRTVEAVAQISGGRIDGASVGATEFAFFPSGSLRGGRYLWDIGTAGSTTMLALTVFPLAAFADQPSHFEIHGGLFQDFAPSAFQLQHVLVPLLARMGLRAELRILKPGFVPRGGGIIELTVQPASGVLRPLVLLDQGRVQRVWGTALSSHLRRQRVSDRMAARCRERLIAGGLDAQIEIDAYYDDAAPQPGAALAVCAECDTGCILGADRAGAPGRPSEAIAETVARMLLADLGSGATVDRHLADQLILFAALADGQTEYIIPDVTEHVRANSWLVAEILGAAVEFSDHHFRIPGIGYRRSNEGKNATSGAAAPPRAAIASAGVSVRSETC